jgi:small subunit ribosomal protein S17
MTLEQAVNRKARVGTVVSDVNDQTVVVEVERASRHRIYRKVIRKTKRYHVHDPNNEATRGDLVRIEECRPISKLKSWRLIEVLTERAVAEVAPEVIGREVVDEVQRSPTRAAEEAAETTGSAAEAPVEEPAAEVVAETTGSAAEAPVEEPAAEVVAETTAAEAAAEPASDADAESSDDEQKAE